MHKRKVLLLLSAVLLVLAGCASRLGYPAKSIGIPTPVTLFTKIVQKPLLTVNMAYGAMDLWKALYQKRYEDVMGGIPAITLHRALDIRFSNDVAKAKDLFAPGSTEVFDLAADYTKAKNDKSAFSGYDFSAMKDSIPTTYILALTIDEWGLLAAVRDTDNGPYVAMTLQLIDKDTNMAAWTYHYQWQQQVDKDANELTKPDMFADILVHIINRGVDQYFMWLGW